MKRHKQGAAKEADYQSGIIIYIYYIYIIYYIIYIIYDIIYII